MTSDDALVHELVHRYAWAVDDLDADAVAECFASDARLVFVSTGATVEGREAIRDFFRTALDPATGAETTHAMTNTVITWSSTGECAVRTAAIVYRASPDAGGVAARGITYTDTCVRTPDGWRFATRQHRLRWTAEMPGGVQAVDPR